MSHVYNTLMLVAQIHYVKNILQYLIIKRYNDIVLTILLKKKKQPQIQLNKRE